MKTTIMFTIVACAFTTSISYGQVKAVQAGSAEARQRIADQQAQLAAQKAAAGELSVNGLTEGSRGTPTWIDAKVMQVIDDQHMLVGIEDSRTGNGRYSNWVMVKVSTKGITDGKFWRGGEWREVTGSDILKVTGTTTYKTAIGGTKTVFVIEPMSQKELDEIAQKQREAAEAAQFRTWMIGEESVVAKLVEFTKDNMVRLQPKEKKEAIEVRMADLTKDDQKWVRDELRRRVEAKRKAEVRKPKQK